MLVEGSGMPRMEPKWELELVMVVKWELGLDWVMVQALMGLKVMAELEVWEGLGEELELEPGAQQGMKCWGWKILISDIVAQLEQRFYTWENLLV